MVQKQYIRANCKGLKQKLRKVPPQYNRKKTYFRGNVNGFTIN